MAHPSIEIAYTNKHGKPDILTVTKGPGWSQISRNSDGMIIGRGSSDRAQAMIDAGKV